MRIVVLADSLALPRCGKGERITWEQTWPYRLGEYLTESIGKCVEVLNYGRRLRTADETLAELDEYVFLRDPQAVIIQVGICDCAPRLFSRRFQRLFLNNKFFHWRLRRLVIDFASRRRAWFLRHTPKKVYLSIQRFRECLMEVAERVYLERPELGLYFISIIPPTDKYEAHSPGVRKNVAAYNATLRDICEKSGAAWIDLDEILKEIRWENVLTSDQIHLNSTGADLLALKLAGHLHKFNTGLSTGRNGQAIVAEHI